MEVVRHLLTGDFVKTILPAKGKENKQYLGIMCIRLSG